MPQKSKRFVFDVGIAFIASLSQMLLGFVIIVVLGKYLGASDLGLYRVLLTIYGLTILVGLIGIPPTMIKYVAEFKDDKNKLNQIVSCGLITSLILGIGFSILFYLRSDIFARIFKMPELLILGKILSPVFPFTFVSNTLLGFLNGLRKMKKYATVIIVQSTLMLIVTVTLIYSNFGISGAVIGFLVSSIGGCLFAVILSKNHFILELDNYIPTIKKLLKFGSKVFGAGAINEISNRLDIILIGIFLKSGDVGYYTAAVSLSRFFWLIPLSIQKITYPATSEYWSTRNYSDLNRMINKVMKYCTVILVLMGLGVCFFAKGIFTILFRKDFAYSALPLQILLIGTVIRGSIAQPIGGSLSGTGRPDLSLKISAIMLITNVVLDLILIPRIGIVGAALATAVSLAGGAIVNLALVIKHLSIKIDLLWFSKISGLALISVFLFYFGTTFINPYLLGSTILIGYSAVVFTVLLAEEDKSTFRSLIHILLARK